MSSRHRRARPSMTLSLSKLSIGPPPIANGTTPQAKVVSPSAPLPRTASQSLLGLSQPSGKPTDQRLSMDPDEIFVKHTVPEVKAIRAKLRTDADAKQEELRVMVGERYRDLLQASTSIIQIAESSKHVRSSLSTMRSLCSVNAEEKVNWEQRRTGHARRYSAVDAQLPILHEFSAHLRLLLDAPEHLWRLLERKKYLQAAWMYLLSRVVYRALVQQEADEDAEQKRWAAYGIDVLAQFPIMQRQWDSISQFRSQISQRATLSMRDMGYTPHQLTETIITILLLDTLPLPDTLSIFLAQRNKALSIQLVQDEQTSLNESEGSPEDITPRRVDVVQDVRDAAGEALATIAGTLGTVRDIFGAVDDRSKSLIEEVMDEIQSGESTSESPVSPGVLDGSRRFSLTPLVRTESSKLPVTTGPLTTAVMLRSFPSAQLLLRFLPSSIQSFTPYIDTSSPSNRIQPSLLRQKTRDWFNGCIALLETHSRRWMSVLDSVKEIWEFRKSILDRISSEDRLREEEKRNLRTWIERTGKARATEIWQRRLRDLEEAAGKELADAERVMRAGLRESEADAHPLDFFFAADLSLPSLPPLTVSNSLVATASFKRYHSALQQRVDGRTPLVQRVLVELEGKAAELRVDFRTLSETGEHEELSRLLGEYLPAAGDTCQRLAKRLRDMLTADGSKTTNDDVSYDLTIFVGRVAFALASHSSFLPDVSFGRAASKEFSESVSQFRSVLRESLVGWRAASVQRALQALGLLSTWQRGKAASPSPTSLPSQPSASLVQALLVLKECISRMGIAVNQRGSEEIVGDLLRDFQDTISAAIGKGGDLASELPAGALWDLSFLLALSDGEVFPKRSSPLLTLVEHLLDEVASSTGLAIDDLRSQLTTSVNRQRQQTQVLFAPLFCKARKTELLGTTAPSMDNDVRIPLDVVKPSPRFGLLLVGSSGVTK